jgi:hypothetical protein
MINCTYKEWPSGQRPGGSSSTSIALTTVSASELQKHIINAELIGMGIIQAVRTRLMAEMSSATFRRLTS